MLLSNWSNYQKIHVIFLSLICINIDLIDEKQFVLPDMPIWFHLIRAVIYPANIYTLPDCKQYLLACTDEYCLGKFSKNLDKCEELTCKSLLWFSQSSCRNLRIGCIIDTTGDISSSSRRVFRGVRPELVITWTPEVSISFSPICDALNSCITWTDTQEHHVHYRKTHLTDSNLLYKNTCILSTTSWNEISRLTCLIILRYIMIWNTNVTLLVSFAAVLSSFLMSSVRWPWAWPGINEERS